MNVKKFAEAMGELHPSHVERALDYRPTQKTHRNRWMATAACLILIAAASLLLPQKSAAPTPDDSDGSGTTEGSEGNGTPGISEGEVALETTELDIYYVSKDDTIKSQRMEVACAPNDIFDKWTDLNSIPDVSLIDCVYDSDGSQLQPEHEGDAEAEHPVGYTIGTHFTLTLTLSREFSRYQEGSRGVLLAESLQKTFAGYLDFDEFLLVVED